MKTCNKCGESKPKSAFYKKTSHKDGLQTHCKLCCSQYYKAYREVHHEELCEKQRNYKKGEERRKKDNASSKERYKAHPDRCLVLTKAWAKAHPEQRWQESHDEYAKKYSADGHFTWQEWMDLKAQHGNKCLCCGRKESEVQIIPDHVIPMPQGGSNWITNIQPLCRSCNSKKHARATDFRLQLVEVSA